MASDGKDEVQNMAPFVGKYVFLKKCVRVA